MNRLSAAALCVLLAAGCHEEANGVKKETVFVSGALLVPGDGTPPIEAATMIIENGVIKQIGKKNELKSPRGALTVDLDGKTITPTFINLHAYPGLSNQKDFSAKNYKRESLSADLRRYQYYGVDAVLAGGDSDGLAAQLRDEIREGKAPGAQLHTSGRGIAAKGTAMAGIALTASGDADARKAVTELADRNADAIVLWAEGLKADATDAVVDEAHKRKLKVFAVAPNLAEAKNLAKAGVDALIGSVTDSEVDDELASTMKEKKIPYAPALTLLESRFVYAEKPSWLGGQFMVEAYPRNLAVYLSDSAIQGTVRRDPKLPTYRKEFETASQNLKKLASAGVPIALGSGSGMLHTFPGLFEHRELELMVKAGMAPLEVFTAATSVPAAALGANDLGALAAGKKANFIVFSSNPLEMIKDSSDIESMYIDAKPVDRLALVADLKTEILKVDAGLRQANQQAEIEERILAEEAKLKHYGKFVAGPSINVTAGLIVPQPRGAKSNASSGPPFKVTVQNSRGAAKDFQDFYGGILPEARWAPAGGCWEKANAAQPGKKWRLCLEPGSGQATLNISVQ